LRQAARFTSMAQLVVPGGGATARVCQQKRGCMGVALTAGAIPQPSAKAVPASVSLARLWWTHAQHARQRDAKHSRLPSHELTSTASKSLRMACIRYTPH
jgi:hypothetical protein